MSGFQARYRYRALTFSIIISTTIITLNTTGSCLLDVQTETVICRGSQGERRCPPGWTCNKNNLCIRAHCGDGIKDPDEECDPGSSEDSPACNCDCTLVVCGDDYLNKTKEECDSGSAITKECNGPTLCTFPRCGDRFFNKAAGEDCDTGSDDTVTCNGANAGSAVGCRFPHCGDFHINTAAGEECDRGDSDTGGSSVGSDSDLRACNGNLAKEARCKFSVCGDSYVNPFTSEECDRGGSDTGSDGSLKAC